MVLVCSKSHPRIKGKIDLDTYLQEEHMGLLMRRSGQRAVDFFARTRLGGRRIVLDCESALSMFAIASRGQLLCSAPRRLSEEYRDQFGLQALALPYEARPVEHYLIAHRRLDSSPAHRWLKDVLLDAISEI